MTKLLKETAMWTVLKWLIGESASKRPAPRTRLTLERLDEREVPAVVAVGDPGYSMAQGRHYAVTDPTKVYAGSISGHGGADVDLFAFHLFKGDKFSVEVSDTWNQNLRKGGLWAQVRFFNPDGSELLNVYHQNRHASFTVARTSGVSKDGTYYVGISARLNDKYDIRTEWNAVPPSKQPASLGDYTIKFNLPMQTAAYNVDAAVKKLDEQANSSSQGVCAKYVRWALEAGGLDTTGHPVNAKDYGRFLLNHGFRVIPKTNYTPQKGDIVVHQAVAGHIAMWDGMRWVSDFKQNDIWAGVPGYLTAANYSIYRR